MTRRQIERQQRLEEIKEVCYDIAGAILLGIILLMAAFV